jgi:subtilisin family serine protease
MLTPLRTAATLIGMCSLLFACGERLEQGASGSKSPTAGARALEARQASSGKLRRASKGAVPGRYIVVFDDSGEHSLRASPLEVSKASGALAQTYGGSVRRVFSSALKGYSASMTEAQALRLSEDPRVRYVEEERTFSITTSGVQNFPTWGLDRIDQRANALDYHYRYESTAAGVHLYVLDTGILETHTEFAGRMGAGFDAIGDGHGTTDCHGHGTHVAGTAGGTIYGVAKEVTLHPVRVVDCTGSGTTEEVLAGIDWVTANHAPLSVANMSITDQRIPSVDEAVSQSIAAGIVYVVGAGNDGWDACQNTPAAVPEAITVGSVNSYDEVSYFSNVGECVDLFAPGEDITSAWATGDTATNTLSGTSMATPHASGAAALYLSVHPTATPADVARELSARATRDMIAGADGSPNLLLHSACMGSTDGVSPQVSLTSPAEGVTLTGTVTLTATASDDVAVTRVEFLADGQLLGTATTAPYSISWNSVDAENGPLVIMARAYDSGCNSQDSVVTVTVQNSGKAVYDATLGAPACLEPSSQCDSGALLVGRGVMGPEVHTPNSLGGSCADGSSQDGFYQLDPSLESIKIIKDDGSLLAGGKQVRVEAFVYAGFDASFERLELYSAPDALAPVWTHLATLSPADFGPNVLTTTIVLPNGTLQALRGVYRLGGTASSCPSGTMDDVDDLVFAAAQETDTQPPTVTMTSPLAGASLSKTVTLGATASDNFGVSRVDFYDGSTLLGSDNSTPYSLSWDTRTVANGAHALSAHAFDAAGFEGTSVVNVTVNNDTTPPTVAFTAPAAGATVTGNATINATASDNVSVVRVELWEGAVKMNTDSAAPYTFTWNTRQSSNGSHTLTLKAFDLAGNVGSVDRTVTSNNDFTAPTVAMTAPAEGATLTGTAVTLSANASDNVGITKVEFYVGTAMVGSDTTAPYSFSLNTRTIANGAKAITAKAFDAAANTTVSAPVNVTIDNDMTGPTCNMTSPANGATVSGVVTMTATASDDRGVVTKVDFFVGSTLLGTDTTAPYTWSWDTSKIATGTYVLKVRGWDPALNTAYSSNVTVTVTR